MEKYNFERTLVGMYGGYQGRSLAKKGSFFGEHDCIFVYFDYISLYSDENTPNILYSCVFVKVYVIQTVF